MSALDPATFATVALIAFACASVTLAALFAVAGDVPPRVPTRPPATGLTPLPDADDSADTSDIAALRMASAHSPVLSWRRDVQGRVTWANRRYLDLVARIEPEAADRWPIPDLFSQALPAGLPGVAVTRRTSLELPDGPRNWFEIAGQQDGEATAFCAVPIDATVRAEDSLRAFMQTLTRTFAHLSTGLAIFDRRRQLILFNPAFLDLTGLEADWLSARPTLSAILDRLRDRNALPEPKDYRAWRDRLASLEDAVSEGDFEEVWSLPDGSVLRVVARPHHDNGLAMMLDDISDEMAMTRKFRSELDIGRAVIDSIDDAVVVFSHSGMQLMANRAYHALWPHSEDDETGAPPRPRSILQACQRWQARSRPGGPWGDIRDFVGSTQNRAEWADTARLVDGTLINCRVLPLAGGATLIAFSSAEPMPMFHAARRDLARA